MKDKEKLTNNIKNCLIAFLFVSAVLLFYKAVFYESNGNLGKISSLFSVKSSLSKTSSSGTKNTVLKTEPIFVLITAKDGSHYSIKYDSQSKSDMFSKFSASLEGALGSSGEPSQISETQWQKVLRSSGVFFDYLYPQPLSFIADCLGTEISGTYSSKYVRRLYLGDNNGNLMLYYIDADDGLIYSCNTALSFSTVSTKIADFPLGNANFAFELGTDYESLDPYFIFSHENGKLRELSITNPLGGNFSADNILSLFGMNSHSVYEYIEDDGSNVYVEGGKTLRIEKSGKMLFSVTGNDGVPISGSDENLSIDDLISFCSSVAEKSIGAMCGDAYLNLVKTKSGSVPSSGEVCFGYLADGIPVSLPDGGYAADFHINGGSITGAELHFRKYTFSGNTILTLPEKQATAIAKSSSGEPLLIYEDNNDSISAKWILN